MFQGTPQQILENSANIDDSCLVKEIILEDFKPFMGDRLERNVRIKKSNNTQILYQDFISKGKIYERYVYNEGLNDINKVTRYNFAYTDGKLCAAAKQDIYKDGHQNGIYSKGKFNPFPIYIRNLGNKKYTVAKDSYSIEALYELNKGFDPDNL